MSTTGDSTKQLDVSGLKLRNSERSINRLPSELLLRIFGVGDEEQRATRNAGEPYYGFQDLITQVCTHWRDVAINAPALWTYIYVSRSPPNHSAALYLDRCGSTALLDIDLEMTNNFYDEYPDSVNSITSRAKDAIEFLIQHGAITSRWKSLLIRSRDSQMLYLALEYVHPQSTPALQYLSVEYSPQVYVIKTIRAENKSENNDPSKILPRLRHVELIALPAGFLFEQSLPMLAGLTHLKLSCEFKLYSQGKLYDMLSANPQLESLDIGGGIIDEDFEPADRRVVLPSLRLLSIASETSCPWTLGIMKMISGPAVEHLKLSYYGYQPDKMVQVIEQIVGHIASEDSTDASPVPTHNLALSHRYAYPTLRHLDVSGLHPVHNQTKVFRNLFWVLPTITLLVARASLFTVLGDQPGLLPHLERIKLIGKPPEGLSRILHRRAEAGYPVKTFEIHEQFLGSVYNTLSESLTITAIPGVYYDSDDDFEGLLEGGCGTITCNFGYDDSGTNSSTEY